MLFIGVFLGSQNTDDIQTREAMDRQKIRSDKPQAKCESHRLSSH